MKKYLSGLVILSFFIAGCCRNGCFTEENCRENCMQYCDSSWCTPPSSDINASTGLPWGYVLLNSDTALKYMQNYIAATDKTLYCVKINKEDNNIMSFLLCNKNAKDIYFNLGQDDAGRFWPIFTYKLEPGGIWENLADDPTDTIPETKCPPGTNCPPRP